MEEEEEYNDEKFENNNENNLRGSLTEKQRDRLLSAENVEALEQQYYQTVQAQQEKRRKLRRKRSSSGGHRRSNSRGGSAQKPQIPTQQDVFNALSGEGGSMRSRASLIYFAAAGLSSNQNQGHI